MNLLYKVFLKIDLFNDWMIKREFNFQATSKLQILYDNVLQVDYDNLLRDEYDKVLHIKYDNILQNEYDNVLQVDYDNVLQVEYDNVLQVDYDNALEGACNNILQVEYDHVLEDAYYNILQVEYENVQGFGGLFFKYKQKSADASRNLTVITARLLPHKVIFIFGYEMTLTPFLTPLNLATY